MIKKLLILLVSLIGVTTNVDNLHASTALSIISTSTFAASNNVFSSVLGDRNDQSIIDQSIINQSIISISSQPQDLSLDQLELLTSTNQPMMHPKVCFRSSHADSYPSYFRHYSQMIWKMNSTGPLLNVTDTSCQFLISYHHSSR